MSEQESKAIGGQEPSPISWWNTASVDFELKEDFRWYIRNGHREDAIKFLEWAERELGNRNND